MIRTISSFKNIFLKPNSLVVLDIDETILGFNTIGKNWWKNTFNNYLMASNDPDLAEKLALYDWMKLVKKTQPIKLDSKNLDIFLEKVSNANCEVLILTARNLILKDLTLNHLSSINIEYSEIVHDKNKGKKLLDLVNTKYNNYNNIIVVDDLVENLEDIKYNFKKYSKYNLDLYNIVHPHLKN